MLIARDSTCYSLMVYGMNWMEDRNVHIGICWNIIEIKPCLNIFRLEMY
jgi:hypothetical protein